MVTIFDSWDSLESPDLGKVFLAAASLDASQSPLAVGLIFLDHHGRVTESISLFSEAAFLLSLPFMIGLGQSVCEYHRECAYV